jgi:hypothetical protein
MLNRLQISRGTASTGAVQVPHIEHTTRNRGKNYSKPTVPTILLSQKC